MASRLTSSVDVIFLFLIAFSFVNASAFEFDVGDTLGWVVPSLNDTNVYNHWASQNRFQVGDILLFKYKKDSVMEVTKEEYSNCSATQPNFFDNSGTTIFKLDQPGPFFFISGATGHCSHGQKMVVMVMSSQEVSHQNGTSTTDPHHQHHHKSSESSASRSGLGKVVLAHFVLAFVATSLF